MKKTLCIVIIFMNVSIAANDSIFLKLCKIKASQPQQLSLSIKQTIDVLQSYVEESDCDKSFEKLNKLEFLSLPGCSLENLLPLSGFSNLKSIDLSDNNIKSLWGIDALVQLEMIYLKDNHISDITPLSFNKNLYLIDLTNNQISYCDPLKELYSLAHLWLENNPIASNEEQMDYIQGMLIFRSLQQRGLNYDFESDDFLEIIYLLEEASQRGDLDLFRSLSQTPSIRAKLTTDSFFDRLSHATQKMILATKYSQEKSFEIIAEYTSILKGQTIPLDHLEKERKRIARILEYTIAKPSLVLRYKRELDEMLGFIKNKLKTRPTIAPDQITKLCCEWKSLAESRSFPSTIRSGFYGL